MDQIFAYFAAGSSQDGEIGGDPGVCSGHGVCGLGDLPTVLYHGVTKPVNYGCVCAPGWTGLSCGARDFPASMLLSTCLEYIPPEQRASCAVDDLVIPLAYTPQWVSATHGVNVTGAAASAACLALGGRLVDFGTFRSLYIGARSVYARWLSAHPPPAATRLCIDAFNGGAINRYLAPVGGVPAAPATRRAVRHHRPPNLCSKHVCAQCERAAECDLVFMINEDPRSFSALHARTHTAGARNDTTVWVLLLPRQC